MISKRQDGGGRCHDITIVAADFRDTRCMPVAGGLLRRRRRTTPKIAVARRAVRPMIFYAAARLHTSAMKAPGAPARLSFRFGHDDIRRDADGRAAAGAASRAFVSAGGAMMGDGADFIKPQSRLTAIFPRACRQPRYRSARARTMATCAFSLT